MGRAAWSTVHTPGRLYIFNRKGFTLIELLIVVVIIGILAAIAIPKFAATKDKAKLSSGNTGSATGVSNGFTATFSNPTISTGIKTCTVTVGAGAASTVDGVIVCS